MTTLTTTNIIWEDLQSEKKWQLKHALFFHVGIAIVLFALAGKTLVWIDPQAGVLDLGILTVGLFGLLIGIASILCCLWLQEFLWQPFSLFRKQFHEHFNQLTSWQQNIIYFSVFFLLLYALLKAFAIVL